MSDDLQRMPPQTKYIVGNEACERFSFYGIVSILTKYATLLYGGTELAKAEATETVHWFKAACYLMPLLGAWLADRFWGRYHTILWLSLAYCAGHALLSIGEGTVWGLFSGLALVAIGSGGIKPCVSAFAGDQFTGGREHLVGRIYNWFYWSINFGSMFAFFYIPKIAEKSYAWAFGLPGIAMGLATIIFWSGRASYIRIPPSRTVPPLPPEEKAADRRTLWRILGIFAPIPFFWAIFDQQNTTWVHQGSALLPWTFLGQTIDGERMQALNAVLILIFIPLFTMVIFPLVERLGIKATYLRKMGSGFFLAGLSFLAAVWLQHRLDAKIPTSVLWQFPQYALLTAGEILISMTGLAFAFTQAPARMKSSIMSYYYVAVALGNVVTAISTRVNSKWVKATAAQEMLYYACLVTLAGVAFALIARRFPTKEPGATAPSTSH